MVVSRFMTEPEERRTRGIYLSSTDDSVMKKYRHAAREVVNREFGRRWYAVEMSELSPDRLPTPEYCKRKVLSCEAFIGIIGPIYGTICEPYDKSYVEFEYGVAADAHRTLALF